MILRFLDLEWKQFYRSSSFNKGIAIKILMGFVVLYFLAIALSLGVGLFFIIEKANPANDPIVLVNNFLIYWFLFDLAFRFFLQPLPFMNIKPLMVVPITKNKIINYLLGKSALSFFNFFPLFIFVPFSVVLLTKDYPFINVFCWLLSIIFFTYSNNFINFLINKINGVFYVISSILLASIGLEYFDIFKLSHFIGIAFNALYAQPYFVVIPFIILICLYLSNFYYLKKGLYLEQLNSKKAEEASTTDLSWLNRFGSLAIFLKNDVKLIWRNARPRQVMLMSFLFLFYGLFFYTNKSYEKIPAILAFASVFITGGFLMTFGQLVPSWDSEYYKLLMSQNIPYKKYLESKWYLMVVAVVVSFVLSTPYLYFGWKIFAMITAGALFNIGLNSFLTLIGGALNRMPIKLNVKAKAFQNTNKFNPTQLVIGLPKIILPMILFYLPYKLLNFEAGIITLGLSGILGFVFRNFFLNLIEKIYQKGKYKTIAAYSETE